MRKTFAEIRLRSRLPQVIGLCADNASGIAAWVNEAQDRLIRAGGETGWCGNSNQTTLTLGVLDVTPSSLPNATLGTPYSQQMTCAGLPTGKTATFAIESGALPTGLTLSTDGLISGTPTAGLPATFEIGVTIA